MSITEDLGEKHFNIRLLIQHPDIDPDIITKELGLVPYRHWRYGTERYNPKGVRLPGKWRDSRWNHVFRYEGRKDFLSALVEIMTSLEDKESFFHRIRREGGKISISAALSGGVHLGDRLDWQLLLKFVEMRIDLGVEVFPVG